MNHKSKRFIILSLLLAVCACDNGPSVVFENGTGASGNTSNISSTIAPGVIISSSPTSEPTNAVSSTPTPSAISVSTSPSPTATVSATPSPTAIPTPTPTATISPSPSASPSSSPSASATPTPEGSPAASVKSEFSELAAFGNNIFIADKKDNKVHVLNAETSYITKSIDVSASPSKFLVSNERNALYVSSKTESVIDIINLNSLEKTGTINLDNPSNDFTIANNLLFSTPSTGNYAGIEAFDLNNNQKFTINTFQFPMLINAFVKASSDNRYLYIAGVAENQSGDNKFNLYKIDISSVSNFFTSSQKSGLGTNLQDMKLSSDDSKLYFASTSPSYIQIIETGALFDGGKLDTGTGSLPQAVYLSRDGKYAVTAQNTKTVKVFDLNTKNILATNVISDSSISTVSDVVVSYDSTQVYAILKGLDVNNSYTERIMYFSELETQ